MEAVKYFEQVEGYFWEWDDRAEFLAIREGNTIAHKQTVIEIIERLEHQGLPKFSAILLCLIATNPDAQDNLDVIYDQLENQFISTSDNFQSFEQLIDSVAKILETITALPEPYKNGQNRLLVFQALFFDCHNIISVKKSNKISQFIIQENILPRTVKHKEFELFINIDLRQLELISLKFKTPEDILKAISDLPMFEEEITLFEKEEDELIHTEDFVESLIEDNKTFAVGALVKRLWSGLNIPLHNESSNQMPLGGVSDLTNKGDFSQLLISEYANDDILFLSRLANNEALYLEREAPPTDTKEKRTILIDSTIKNWGTPKTIAFAIGIALAEHPRNKVAYQAIILGEETTEINLNDKESIIVGLQQLNGSLHPAKALEDYLKEHSGDKEELIFITEKSNLKQAKLLEVLHTYQADINFIIETNNEGSIDIYKKNRSGKKHLQRITLPIEQLWQAKPKNKKKSIPTIVDKIDHYPILFDTPTNKSVTLCTDDGFIYIITRDKKLFRKVSCYRTNEKGWELVKQDLPISYGYFEIGIKSNGMHTLLLFDNHKRIVFLLDIFTGEQTDFLFSHWNEYSPDFIFHNGAFRHHDWKIDANWKLTQAEMLSQITINHRKEQIENADKRYHIVRNVLRNVKSVRISSEKKLVFNKHEFALKSHMHFKLDVCRTSLFDAESEIMDDKVFQFAEGSTVQMNRAGMLTLTSSDDSIEPIFIPSTLDCALGVSTLNSFSGREFYHSRKLVKLFLNDSGIEVLTLARALTNYTDRNLEELSKIISQAPCYLDIILDIKNGSELVKHLIQTVGGGVNIELVPYDNKEEQIELKPDVFYERYITPFINNILSHETSA